MSLLQLVVVAALQGAAEVLPVSLSGHAAVAKLWDIRADGGPAIDAALLLSTALAVRAFLAARLAASALRSLVARRRLPALALWIIPLGLALLAYARALPGSGS